MLALKSSYSLLPGLGGFGHFHDIQRKLGDPALCFFHKVAERISELFRTKGTAWKQVWHVGPRLWSSRQAWKLTMPLTLFTLSHQDYTNSSSGVVAGQDSDNMPWRVNIFCRLRCGRRCRTLLFWIPYWKHGKGTRLRAGGETMFLLCYVTWIFVKITLFICRIGVIVLALPTSTGLLWGIKGEPICEALYNLWNANKCKEWLGFVAVGTETSPRRIQWTCFGGLAPKQYCTARTVKHSLSHLSAGLGVIFRCRRWADSR